MKRLFDIYFGIVLLIILLIPMITISIILLLLEGRPILYWSDRVGKNNKIFKMPKFRSMKAGTPEVATHLLEDSDLFITPIGVFLRRTSLDEVPQILSVLKGDMSFVGPRPALFNQMDLIELRTNKGVNKLLPGITGWAQINGRDELSITNKVTLDAEYLYKQSFWFDIKILWATLVKVIGKKG
jgi:O-antigen biosynthesis protein WbqP